VSGKRIEEAGQLMKRALYVTGQESRSKLVRPSIFPGSLNETRGKKTITRRERGGLGATDDTIPPRCAQPW
jgi:hypothetical protein